jgi:hypothetical protein
VAGDQDLSSSVACPQFEPWHPGGVDERTWLTVPDIAERLDVSASEDRNLLAVRRDGVVSVPEVFVTDEGPLPELRGTAILLGDGGFDNDAAVRWLLEPDDSLGVAPIDALLAGRKAEVRRVAQALAL